MRVTHQRDYTADSATKHPDHTGLPKAIIQESEILFKKTLLQPYYPWLFLEKEEEINSSDCVF